jgi:ElaA protein
VPQIWVCKSFDELSREELYGILALRQEVFIVEQRCPYADADGRDLDAAHLFCLEAGRVIACARLFAPGPAEAVIGRVVTSPAVRRTGLGRELMRRAIDALRDQHGPTAIRLGAQSYLERFYGSFGFIRAGEDYLEDGIPHLPMRRPAQP